MLTFFYYIIAAIFLFLINIYLKRKEVKVSTDILFPICYLLIICAIFSLNHIEYHHSYLILLITMFLELFYYGYLYDNKLMFPMSYFLKKYFIILFISIFLEMYIFPNSSFILPSIDTIRNAIWLFVILYLYNLLNNYLSSISKTKPINDFLNKEYIISSYAKYKSKYNYLLKDYDIPVKDCLYAIMIYEATNTTKLKRNIDNFLFGKVNKISKLGIMQVKTKIFITDEESIRLVSNTLEKDYERYNKKTTNIVEKLLNNYIKDKEKVRNIYTIYKEIVEFKTLN